MTINTTTLLSTANSQVKIPDLSQFKYSNDIATQSEYYRWCSDMSNWLHWIDHVPGNDVPPYSNKDPNTRGYIQDLLNWFYLIDHTPGDVMPSYYDRKTNEMGYTQSLTNWLYHIDYTPGSSSPPPSYSNKDPNTPGHLQNLHASILNLKQEILNSIYKVGDIIYSANPENPSVKFGGTWVEYAQGMVLIGNGTRNDGRETRTFKEGEYGGEFTHTTTWNEMPAHSHYIVTANERHENMNDASLNIIANPEYSIIGLASSSGNSGNYYLKRDDTASPTAGVSSGSGRGYAHNNMQPYLVVYIWRKIA